MLFPFCYSLLYPYRAEPRVSSFIHSLFVHSFVGLFATPTNYFTPGTLSYPHILPAKIPEDNELGVNKHRH